MFEFEKHKVVTDDIRRALWKYPLHSQVGMKMNAVVIARFFGGAFTFYALGGDKIQMFGLCDVGDGFSYCTISIHELETINMWGGFHGAKVERDIGVPICKMTLGECMAAYREHYGA